MDKKLCKHCPYKMLAYDNSKTKLKTWEHCDHPLGNKPILKISSCPNTNHKNKLKTQQTINFLNKQNFYKTGCPFCKSKNISEKPISGFIILFQCNNCKKMFDDEHTIPSKKISKKRKKSKKPVKLKPKPPKPRIQTKYKNL